MDGIIEEWRHKFNGPEAMQVCMCEKPAYVYDFLKWYFVVVEIL